MSFLDEVKALVQSSQPDRPARIYAAAEAAVCEGDPDAHLLMSVLRGAGIGAPQDWSAALDHLEAAAQAGSDAARAQLALLGHAAPADDWRALRASINVESWLAPSVRQVLSAAPRVVTIDGFVSPAVCDWLIGRARGRTDRAKVFDAQAGGAAADDAGRSNTAFEFSFLELDLVVLLVRARIAATIGFPVTAFEPTQVLHYEAGQRFAPHHDYLDPSMPGHGAEIARRGQRAVTLLIYLNDAFEGGETHFPVIGIRRRCPTGGALCFGNVDTAGVPDPRTLHEGAAPTRGEKWLLSQWIRIQSVV
jgi:hypothetical protein